jgi:hypothetical protein
MTWVLIIVLVVLGLMTMGHHYALERLERMHIALLEELIDLGILKDRTKE